MCYFNRLTRVAHWLADYPEWLQFCWDFVKPPSNGKIALQHFFLLAAVQEFFPISFVLHAIFFVTSTCRKFFSKSPPPPPQELNGQPLVSLSTHCFITY